MIRVVAFEPDHLVAIDAQPAQRELCGDRRSRARALSATGRCFTALRASDGAPIFCGGALTTHVDYATVWAACAHDAGPALLAIERRTRRFLGMLSERRIDTLVRHDFAAGRRWIERLGFVVEAVVGDYFEDGGDGVIYRMKGRG